MRMMTRFAAVAALVNALAFVPASAQEGDRFSVLVPSLEPQSQANERFGRDVADELRDLIEDMPTHQPVAENEVRDALRRFRIDEDDLDCVRSRQLAVQLGAELVMCGTYTPAADRQFTVAASFIAARTGERFEVAPFQAGRDRDAARAIFQSFNTYVEQVRQTTFCLEYLASEQYTTALDVCGTALAGNPRSATAQYAVARARLGLAVQKDEAEQFVLPENERMQYLNESLEGLRQVIEINPMHQEALQSAGYVATQLGQRETGLEYYRQYLELNPGALNVRLTIATDLANAGNPEGALDLLVEGITAAGENADAALYEYAGHFAIGAAVAARQMADSLPAGARQPAELFDQASEYYRRAIELGGENATATLRRQHAQALSFNQRYDEALAVTEAAMITNGDDPGILQTHATLLNEAGRTDEAIRTLERWAQVDTAAKVNALQGLWIAQAGRIADARAAFERARAAGEITDDTYADHVAAIGNQALRDRQYDAAVSAFELSREVASSGVARARGSYYAGYALLQRAIAVEQPATAASARSALPIFRRAQEHLRQAGAFGEAQPSSNLNGLIDAVSQYIARQEQIISASR